MNLGTLGATRTRTCALEDARADRTKALISSSHRSVPAVVVGAAGPCGLGVVRSLSRADIPVILADPNPVAPAMHTRLARKHVISSLAGRPLIEDLLALSATIDRPSVLFLTNDEAAMAVSKFRGELEGHYRFRLPSHDCLTSLLHKQSFQQLAERYGFPVPRSTFVRRPSDFGALANLRFPCIVKPAVKMAEYLQLFARAYKVHSKEEAEAVCSSILPVAPDLMVQEWIEGGDDAIYFCLQYGAADGQAVCSFTGRKLTIWPPDVGETASCTAAPDAHAILGPLTEAFFRKVAFTGIGGIEYKKDARTGAFLMVEPTVGRVDRQEEVATLHGVNIPLAAYCYELGFPMPSLHARSEPIIWRDLLRHWKATWGAQPKQGGRPRYRICGSYWRANDPIPALFHGLAPSIRLLQKAINWAKGRLCVDRSPIPRRFASCGCKLSSPSFLTTRSLRTSDNAQRDRLHNPGDSVYEPHESPESATLDEVPRSSH
jgi:D-aspartate ligase